MATFKLTHTYQHSAEQVVSLSQQDECIRERLLQHGVNDIEISRDDNTVHLYYVVNRDLPDFIPRLLRNKIKAVASKLSPSHQEAWSQLDNEQHQCLMQAEVEKLQIKIKNQSLYSENSEGHCVCETTMTVTCGLPIIGDKLADFIADDNKKALEKEVAALTKYFNVQSA